MEKILCFGEVTCQDCDHTDADKDQVQIDKVSIIELSWDTLLT
jgi:hypothetical protein